MEQLRESVREALQERESCALQDRYRANSGQADCYRLAGLGLRDEIGGETDAVGAILTGCCDRNRSEIAHHPARAHRDRHQASQRHCRGYLKHDLIQSGTAPGTASVRDTRGLAADKDLRTGKLIARKWARGFIAGNGPKAGPPDDEDISRLHWVIKRCDLVIRPGNHSRSDTIAAQAIGAEAALCDRDRQ